MANLLSLGTAFAGLFGPDAILSSSGVPVVSTPVTVYQSDGTTVVVLYTDQTKGTTTGNPVSTDSYGNLFFYTNPGIYILAFTVGGIPTTKTVTVDPFYTDSAWNVVTDTANASPLSGDSRLANANSGSILETLPAPALGVRVKVTKTDSSVNGVTLTPSSGSIYGVGLGSSGVSSLVLYEPGSAVELHGDGSNYHMMSGSNFPFLLNEANGNIPIDVPLVKVGRVGATYSTGGVDVVFATAFPNNWLSGTVTPETTGGASQAQLVTTGVGGFQVALYEPGGTQLSSGTTYIFDYIAIGN